MIDLIVFLYNIINAKAPFFILIISVVSSIVIVRVHDRMIVIDRFCPLFKSNGKKCRKRPNGRGR
jgi:hypothetical protein